jgi:poly(A) polymerase
LRIRYATEKDGKPVKKAVVYTQDEHGINVTNVDAEAVHIIERLKAGGYEGYIVGGAVRDLILGKKPKDFDIVSDASPTRIKKLFRTARIIGHRFRLVHVSFGPKIFEVSTFRSLEGGANSNTYGTIEEDVLRRDFSLNALFYDPLTQVVVDYVGGMKDIQEKRIRPIIPLATIFKDDPVRMIRAVKYAATTGCKLPLSLKWQIRREFRLLADISPSRLTEEIFKIIHGSATALIVENLEAFGLYAYLQPNAVQLMKGKGDFRTRYFNRLAALHQEGSTGVPGEAIAALVWDYLEDTIDWAGEGIAEQYKDIFMAARRFVLPMNPPRVELDQGVRLIFKRHGITIKKSRFPERERPPFPARIAGVQRPDTQAYPQAEAVPKKRHRRHRRDESPHTDDS